MQWVKDWFFSIFVGIFCAFFSFFIYDVPVGRLRAVFLLGLIIGLILDYIMNRFDIGRTFFPMFFSFFLVLGIGLFIIFPAVSQRKINNYWRNSHNRSANGLNNAD